MRFVQRCPTSDFQPARTGPWVRAASERLTQAFPAAHRAQDQILTTGQPITLHAQLNYGEEPLVDEWVRIFWGGCERGWEQIGQARTDAHGRVTWRLSRQVPRGRYAYAVQVAGDRTFVQGYIWVVAPEVRAVAISASAILVAAPTDAAPESEPNPASPEPTADPSTSAPPATAASSSDTPDPAPQTEPQFSLAEGALNLASHYAQRGYLIIYLAEDPWSDVLTPHALGQLGLPAGPVLMAAEQGAADSALATPGDVWEDASPRGTGGGPPAAIQLTRHYVASPDTARHPAALPLRAAEVIALDDSGGWQSHLQELGTSSSKTPKTDGPTQIIRPAHAVPNYPRRSD